jgi:predicted histone-like DNA-binding protein
MPTKYNVIPKRNPRNPTAPQRYYPSVVTGGRLTLRQLARQISEMSTVSTMDTMAVLEGLLTVIPREITNGNIVELGEFGSFRLRVQSEGADTANAVNASYITNIKPLFAPGKEFKKTLNNAEFEKASS